MTRLAAVLNRIARAELGGRKPRVGDEAPCPFCQQTLRLVESYDLEYLLQTGQQVRSGTTWIHLGPDEAARCRRQRAQGR